MDPLQSKLSDIQARLTIENNENQYDNLYFKTNSNPIDPHRVLSSKSLSKCIKCWEYEVGYSHRLTIK